MATLFKPTRPYPLPSNPEIVEKDGKPHVRMRDGGKLVSYPITKDGANFLKPAKKWYGKYRDAAGVVQKTPLSPNKDAAKLMLADLLRKIENEKVGVRDVFADHRKRTVADHLNDWKASLRANNRGPDYIAEKVGRVQAVCSECGFVFPNDLAADRVEQFLAGLRNTRPPGPILDPQRTEFTPREVAHTLGVTVGAVAALVRRHRLAATGNGKGRRLPRATVEAIIAARPTALSVQTVNHWLQAAKQFGKWMVENDRIERNPFIRLKPGNARTDQRHRRGELTLDEVSALLSTVGVSRVDFRGLTGLDRAILYRMALGSGFRRAELAALTPEAFDLDSTQPTATLAPEHTKNRKGVIQVLPRTLAALLRDYLDGRPPGVPVWPGTWRKRASEMLQADLIAAGVSYTIDSSEGTEHRDFHALRATYISNTIRAGATLKEAMTMARHSDPKLTMSRYARIQIHDLGGVADRLPVPTTPSVEPHALRLTGTDGGCSAYVPPDVPAGGNQGGKLRTVENVGGGAGTPTSSPKPLEVQKIGSGREESRTDEKVPPARFERATPGLGNRFGASTDIQRCPQQP